MSQTKSLRSVHVTIQISPCHRPFEYFEEREFNTGNWLHRRWKSWEAKEGNEEPRNCQEQKAITLSHGSSVSPSVCLTLCDPMDCSLAGSSVHGILQARIPEWLAMPFFRASSLPRDRTQVSSTGRQILYHVSHRTIPGPLDLGEPREAGPGGNRPVRRWSQETGPCWGRYGTHRGLLPAPVLGLWPNPDRSRRHRAWEMHQGRGRHPGLQ